MGNKLERDYIFIVTALPPSANGVTFLLDNHMGVLVARFLFIE